MKKPQISDELKVLRRIELLLETMSKAALAERLNKHLENKGSRIVYENTGLLTRPELERKTGFSAGKISGLWKQWAQEGLVVKDGKSFRRVL